MILYIPTSEAESIYELIEAFGENILPKYLISDLKIQINEQLPAQKNIKTVNIKELVEQHIKNYGNT